MITRRARVIAAESAAAAPRVEAASPPRPARVAPATLVAAEQRAREILAQAEAAGAGLIAEARRESAEVRLRAEAEGRAEGAAALAAQVIALAAHEARADEQRLERHLAIARLLAERLLGEQLQLDPSRVAALARQALAETRGARRVTIVAHPHDAAVLEGTLPTLGVAAGVVSIAGDPARTRGDLRIETDVGVLDAAIAPQLERLARRLREMLVAE